MKVDLRNWQPAAAARTTVIIEWFLLGALLYALGTSISVSKPVEADTCTVGVDCCESGL